MPAVCVSLPPCRKSRVAVAIVSASSSSVEVVGAAAVVVVAVADKPVRNDLAEQQACRTQGDR